VFTALAMFGFEEGENLFVHRARHVWFRRRRKPFPRR
jgi:hypothetical protein